MQDGWDRSVLEQNTWRLLESMQARIIYIRGADSNADSRLFEYLAGTSDTVSQNYYNGTLNIN